MKTFLLRGYHLSQVCPHYINTYMDKHYPGRFRHYFYPRLSPLAAISCHLGWLKYIEIACSRLSVPSSAERLCCCITTPAALVEQGLAGYGIGAKAVSIYVGETKPHTFSLREGMPESKTTSEPKILVDERVRAEALRPTEAARRKQTLFGKNFEYTGEHPLRFTRS